jgi:peptide/nickel transport system substrate-binding protein
MRPFAWRLVAVSSMLAVALAAHAETRPAYGGMLHVSMRAAPTSLDPADGSANDSFARSSLTMLIFDTLVANDEADRVRPSLAISWQTSGTNQHWQFRLRHGVSFQDGSLLTPESVAASLRSANPTWNVTAAKDLVTIELEAPDPLLLAELAMPRNAIAKRNSDGVPSGTGPFRVVEWQPGKKLTLAAFEDSWQGRPFLDAIEVEFGKGFREQTVALELGQADLVEVGPEQLHRLSSEGRRVTNSAPVDLIALVFTRDAQTADDKLLREALAWTLERGSMRSVLFQGEGEPAAGLLPNWISGYAFLFPTEADLPRARHAREQVRSVPQWTLGYDGNDPLGRLLADRIALNARDAGLSVQPTSANTVDLRVVRIAVNSTDPWVALHDIAHPMGIPDAKSGGSVEDLYAAELAILATQRVIPLFHLPMSYCASPAVKNWTVRADGIFHLADAWLGSTKP